MMKIALISLAPLYLPATCWVAGCECEWLCSAFNAVGCTAVAGLAAAGIFILLSFIHAFQGLDAIRD